MSTRTDTGTHHCTHARAATGTGRMSARADTGRAVKGTGAQAQAQPSAGRAGAQPQPQPQPQPQAAQPQGAQAQPHAG